MKFLTYPLVITLALCFSLSLPGQYALPAAELANIPVEGMPVQNNVELLAGEMDKRADGRPDAFAVTISTKIRPSTHGVWTGEGRTSVWRSRISSPGAETLNLGFSEFHLPQGGELYLRSPESRFGPFTPADEEDHNQLWTPVLEGDELMIELRVPRGTEEEVQLYLTAVNHDFVNVNKSLPGQCNVDVICGSADGFPLVDNYRDIIRSVAAYSINGNQTCTGFLVNNVNNDGTPLFMTANHCRVSADRAASVVTYWNYENSVCRPVIEGSGADSPNADGSRAIFNTGAELLAAFGGSDVTILRLDDPVNPDANAFFAGWSAEASLPRDTMIAIHHPGLREKRISFSFSDPFRTDYLNPNSTPIGSFLGIPFWDIGTTEGGSSGSPIFDRFKRVRGQLRGGRAACTNPDASDWYGYFHSSWEGGGTPETRIKDWLDPCGTGTLTIDGLEASELPFTLVAESNCAASCVGQSNQFTLTLGEGFPEGTTLTVVSADAALSPVLTATTAAGGDQVVVLLPESASVPTGSYTIVVRAEGGGRSHDISLVADLVNPSSPAPLPLAPADGMTDVVSGVTFNWSAVGGAQAYDFQISADADFSTIIAGEVDLTEPNYTYDGDFMGGATYHWRSRVASSCGNGDWSSAVFTAADLECAGFNASALPAVISDEGTPTVEIDFVVAGDFNVLSLEVRLGIEHTFIGDLSAILRGPDGTEIQLFNRPLFCSSDDIYVTFSPDAAMTGEDFTDDCANGYARRPLAYQPGEAFTPFLSTSAKGTWTLILTDNADEDGGQIVDARLAICTDGEIPDFSISATAGEIDVCTNESARVVLNLGGGFTDEVDLRVEAGDQMLDNYTFDVNTADGIATVNFTAWTLLGRGSYAVRFVFLTEDGAEQVFTLPLRVTAPARPAGLISPGNGAGMTEGPITFDWEETPNAEEYIFQYANQENFGGLVVERPTNVSRITIADLPLDQSVFWRVITRNRCGEAISEVRQFDLWPVGVNDFGDEHSILVYPNPATDHVTIETTGNWPGGVSATLFDAAGRRVADYRMANGGRAEWELDRLPTGVYYLRFAARGTVRTERLVVTR